MSLFFKERIDEQIINPSHGKVIFTFPWIISIADADAGDIAQNNPRTTFGTNFAVANESWDAYMIHDSLIVTYNLSKKITKRHQRTWKKGVCNISYILYQDNDMLIELYSSLKIKMKENINREFFFSSAKFMKQYFDAMKEKNAAKVVFFIELVLPTKPFCYPFYKELPWKKKFCFDYPATNDVENVLMFSFMNNGDFIIQCPDGTINAFRSTLFAASAFFSTQFRTAIFNESNKIAVEHSIDVVYPVIVFLHTLCFEMPKFYDLDFAYRLLKVIDLFQPYQRDAYDIKMAVHQSLCLKFIGQYNTNFHKLLRWTSIACQFSLTQLYKMVVTFIASNYYFRWLEAFPQNERNLDSPLYREIFGIKNDNVVPHKMFKKVDKIFRESLCTNVILD